MRILNNPTEMALRLSFILGNSKKPADLQRLMYYNYIAIHSSDIEKSKKSLHPQIPHRSCKMLIGREIIKNALILLESKKLIKINIKFCLTKESKNGILIKSSRAA